MAVLEKIRVKLGVFITVLIAIALLSFIIDPNTLESTLQMFSSKYDVGKMNGESISYREFEKRTNYFSEIYQMTSNGNTEDQSEVVSNMAWQDEITRLVVLPAIENAGIKLGKAELTELTQGSHISPVLSQNPFFVDENGNYDKSKLSQFIQAAASDETGKVANFWKFTQDNIVQTALLEKYYALLQQSMVSTPLELARDMEESNTTYNVNFTILPMTAPDSSIVVSSDEIKAYYNARKDKMKQPASKDVEYVVWEVVPSVEDVNFAQGEMDKVYPEFVATDNVKAFIQRNSSVPMNQMYFTPEQFTSLSASLAEFMNGNPAVGSFLEPYQEGNNFYAAKVMDTQMLPDSVFVKHILLRGENEQKADSLKAVASKSAENFLAVAAEYSDDKNPNVEEIGDLGWLTQQFMLPGFESVMTMPVGQVEKMTSQYGTHLVKVTKKTAPSKKYQVAVLCKEAVAGKQTYAEYYAKANELATASNGKIDAFNTYVKENNVTVYPAMNILPASRSFVSYERAREIVRWINDNPVGSVSSILSLDNRYYFVVAVTGEHAEGIVPLEQVAPQIKQTLSGEKQLALMASQCKEKTASASNLDEVAQILGTSITSRDGIAFSTLQPQQIDYKFLGALANAKEGELNGPVEGQIGVYYFTVNGIDKGAFYTEDDAKTKKGQQFAYVMRALPYILSEQAQIEDMRYKFY